MRNNSIRVTPLLMLSLVLTLIVSSSPALSFRVGTSLGGFGGSHGSRSVIGGGIGGIGGIRCPQLPGVGKSTGKDVVQGIRNGLSV